MKKMIVVVILVAAAWWYFDGSRKISEASIRTFHAEQLAAFDRHDAELLCESMTDDYQGRTTTHGPEGTRTRTLGREETCRELDQGIEMFRHLDNASRGMLKPSFDIQIKRVEIAIDRKSATVESVVTLKVGDTMLSRTRSTDTLVRRMGRILSASTESRNWVYVE